MAGDEKMMWRELGTWGRFGQRQFDFGGAVVADLGQVARARLGFVSPIAPSPTASLSSPLASPQTSPSSPAEGSRRRRAGTMTPAIGRCAGAGVASGSPPPAATSWRAPCRERRVAGARARGGGCWSIACRRQRIEGAHGRAEAAGSDPAWLRRRPGAASSADLASFPAAGGRATVVESRWGPRAGHSGGLGAPQLHLADRDLRVPHSGSRCELFSAVPILEDGVADGLQVPVRQPDPDARRCDQEHYVPSGLWAPHPLPSLYFN